MGFMDKAKKMAEQAQQPGGIADKAKKMADQAQQKLDEAQTKFNEGQSQQSGQGGPGGGVTYDEHGRPVQTAGESQPPPAESPEAPSAPPGEGEPAPEPTPEEPREDPGASAAKPAGNANTNPDPFKPIE